MARAVDKVRDRLGKAVTPGIRETGIVMNLLRLQTRQSCEGHVSLAGHGHSAPWVDLLEPSRDRARLNAYLGAFYRGLRKVDRDVELIVEDARIRALSLVSGALTTDEVTIFRAHLALGQAEMARITAYLTSTPSGAVSPGSARMGHEAGSECPQADLLRF